MDLSMPYVAQSVRGNIAELSDEVREQRRNTQLALVNMPFATTLYPSIQLGLLSSIARSHGFTADTFHFNLDLAHQIGQGTYIALTLHRGRQLGDWLFSVEAFREEAPDPAGELVNEILMELFGLFPGKQMSAGLSKNPAHILQSIRREAIPQFLDGLMETVNWQQYKVVGFTSTFQQNTASFALARRIKEVSPDTLILFGGANFDGEMGIELLHSVEFIDYAIIGEADQAFAEFLVALQEGNDPLDIPGVIGRQQGTLKDDPGLRPLFRDMDNLPTPNYDEFYDRRHNLPLPDGEVWWDRGVLVESSRGCWWGEKSHCTFCGLNGATMAYRSKSPERFVEELGEIAQAYGKFDFFVVDNILDLKYLKNFFGHVTDSKMDYTFFYEVKANLSRQQVELLAKGGVTSMQPGIESLNTHLLDLMRKGVSAIQNINLLRWSVYYNISLIWNILCGFPGETQEDYDSQVALIPHLYHLQPPIFLTAVKIWMERFSPIFFERDTFPAKKIDAEMSYYYIYPERFDHQKLAYFFDYELEDTLPESAYSPVKAALRDWQRLWKDPKKAPTLTYSYSPKRLHIDDRRDRDNPKDLLYDALSAQVYLACSDQTQSVASMRREFGKETVSNQDLETILATFVADKVMFEEQGKFLSLALPRIKRR